MGCVYYLQCVDCKLLRRKITKISWKRIFHLPEKLKKKNTTIALRCLMTIDQCEELYLLFIWVDNFFFSTAKLFLYIFIHLS